MQIIFYLNLLERVLQTKDKLDQSLLLLNLKRQISVLEEFSQEVLYLLVVILIDIQ